MYTTVSNTCNTRSGGKVSHVNDFPLDFESNLGKSYVF